MAKILFGRNGATKDVARAMHWYRRIALEMKDPSSMYDYSVLLLKVRLDPNQPYHTGILLNH